MKPYCPLKVKRMHSWNPLQLRSIKLNIEGAFLFQHKHFNPLQKSIPHVKAKYVGLLLQLLLFLFLIFFPCWLYAYLIFPINQIFKIITKIHLPLTISSSKLLTTTPLRTLRQLSQTLRGLLPRDSCNKKRTLYKIWSYIYREDYDETTWRREKSPKVIKNINFCWGLHIYFIVYDYDDSLKSKLIIILMEWLLDGSQLSFTFGSVLCSQKFLFVLVFFTI